MLKLGAPLESPNLHICGVGRDVAFVASMIVCLKFGFRFACVFTNNFLDTLDFASGGHIDKSKNKKKVFKFAIEKKINP